MSNVFKRHWRDYRTVSGRRPVKEFLEELSDEEVADVAAAMEEVRQEGLPAARHLRADVYEVRAESANRSFRILFAAEGRFHQVLLSLVGFSKKTRKTPPQHIDLAQRRLDEWRSRGRGKK